LYSFQGLLKEVSSATSTTRRAMQKWAVGWHNTHALCKTE
jgi:hypothetical protein